MARRRFDFHALRNVGALDDERHAGDFFVHRRLAPQPARAEIVAVIGRIEHARIAGEPDSLERAQHLADVVVEKSA